MRKDKIEKEKRNREISGGLKRFKLKNDLIKEKVEVRERIKRKRCIGKIRR